MPAPMQATRATVPFWEPALLNSYSQVLFSQDRVLAVCILLVTFLNPWSGFCGITVTFLVILLSGYLGIDRSFITGGGLGFNALLLGLFVGSRFDISSGTLVLLPLASLLVILLITALGGWLGKHHLPILSFPFLIASWILDLASGEIPSLAYTDTSGNRWNLFWQISQVADTLPLPEPVLAYFQAMSGAFFQQGVLGGMMIAIALWRVSRIMFSLTVIGFAATYAISLVPGTNCIPVCMDAGPNAIFLALGIAGHYLVAGPGAYLALLMLIPILLLLVKATEPMMNAAGLHGYTFPFSILTVVFLSFLYQRRTTPWLQVVGIQYYAPEKTLYKHLSATERFRNAGFASLSLPFWGKWKVSQGYEGGITHIGEYAEALDFVISDEHGNTWNPPGKQCTDFYCYDKPVIAPMAGYIHAITDHIEDNPIGEVDTDRNWGNTIIINHQNGLFSQLSHLRKGTLKVSPGEYVEKGAILALCGNSGRSPEPHIHFQMQQSGALGAPAIAYPISCFIEHTEKGSALRTFSVPKEGTFISNLVPDPGLQEALRLTPGKVLRFAKSDAPENIIAWEVHTDSLNRSYLWCRNTNATVWFANDGNMFYCYDFEGNTSSLLYNFYLATYRVLLGNYPEVLMKDEYPLSEGFNFPFSWVQDLIAPFYRYAHARYESRNIATDDHIRIQSKTTLILGGRPFRKQEHTLVIREKRIAALIHYTENQKEEYQCIG